MGLGDSVEALLETYSKCLALLHVFSSNTSSSGPRSPAAPSSPVDWDRHSELGRSLHDDRAKIQKAYSARLSETGSRLQKGDGRSRSTLRRIVRRLTDALSSILGFGSGRGSVSMSDGRPLLNYDALRALSNASRVDAIQAIDEVSVRLNSRSSMSGTPSRGTTRASSGRASSSFVSAPAAAPMPHPEHRPRQHQSSTRHHRTAGAGAGSSSSSRGGRSPGRQNTAKPNSGSRSGTPQANKASGKHRQSSSRSTNNSMSSDRNTVITKGRPSQDPAGTPGRRVSMVSSSSASTRLGEIPERKLRRRQAPTHHPDERRGDAIPEYNVRPAYPMRPVYHMRPLYVPEAEEKRPKKGFWGMFR